MRDLSLHILDIVENSAKAGATRVDLTLRRNGRRIELRVADNGPGLPPSVRPDPSDPFRTTRTERKVGLGLALLRQTAEEAAGEFAVEEPPSGGVTVSCAYDLEHIDAKPPGDLTGAVLVALLAWPNLRLVLFVGEAGEPVLDSALLRDLLEGVGLDSPRVQNYLREQLDNAFQDLLGSQL